MCLLCKSSLVGTAAGEKAHSFLGNCTCHYSDAQHSRWIVCWCCLAERICATTVSCRKITVAKKSHSKNANGFTIYTIAVNSTSRGDREECQRVWHAVYADMHKMVSVTLELFSTCSSRQMRLTVRREPNGESVPD